MLTECTHSCGFQRNPAFNFKADDFSAAFQYKIYLIIPISPVVYSISL